ncbi:MAG: transglycosylase domain-containing protein [Cytophagales bacterium]|nr:transglycosylase domain-containing protein [Bernardetiaceae bacterium]MDW8210892.1 transglycosylase domain-containing protein [Cytophagales bacterium]
MYLRLIRLGWTLFFTSFLIAILWVLAVNNNWGGLFGGMPDLTKIENPKSEVASELWSADGVLLGKYFRRNRTPVRYQEISPYLLYALYATEDIRFEQHSGIDLRGTLSIFFSLLRGKKRGGSTITQQLAKNLFSTRQNLKGKLGNLPLLGTLIAKTKEWILAVHLERSYTKQEIVTMYLNEVELGNNSFGIKVAARTYFNTTPDSLTVPQAAMLVGMLKAPTRYSPIRNPDLALARRNIVIDQMEKYGFITPAEAERYRRTPIKVANVQTDDHVSGLAPYFRMEIRKDLLNWCAKNGYDLFADGLKIYTTIDSRMQRYAEEAVTEHMKELQARFFEHWKGRNPWVDENFRELPDFIDKAIRRTDHYRILKNLYGDDTISIFQQLNTPVPMKVFSWQAPNYEIDTLMSPIDSVKYFKKFLHAGLMSLDPYTGHIKAWVGGINFKFFSYDHVRQGARQPGSAFKPIIYAVAIAEHGYSPCTEVVDAPQTFVLESGQTWTAKNFGAYTGNTYTLRQALAQSINTTAAFLMRRVRPSEVIRYARQMGITTPLDEVPSLALGAGGDVSVFDLTGAYATFVNKGVWIQPTYITHITDKNGKVLQRFVPQKREVFDEEKAYTMVYMLRGAAEERNGTGLGLYRYKFRQGTQVACKTGTTQNYSDGWFIGMTKDLVTGIWVGGDERSIHFRTGDYGQGSRMAMPIFGIYMDKIFADPQLAPYNTKGEFPKPENFSVELDCSKAHQRILDSVSYLLPTSNPLKD